MKRQIALLGCVILAGNVAIANVDCAKAPYGESVARYGRDEFQLGMIAKMHSGSGTTVARTMIRRVDKAMRAACRAKFQGRNLHRYVKLGLPPRMLAAISVGSIAAVVLNWKRQPRPEGGAASRPLRTAGASVPANRPRTSGSTVAPSVVAHANVVKITSNFPACPRRTDLKRLLTAALINKSGWSQAKAIGKRHGCIELHAGERVDRLRSDQWGGVTQVRREGHTRTYWTDSMAVR